jgi:hypothetical protein
MTLYVINLPSGATAGDLRRLFARFGRVAGVDIWVGSGENAGERAAVVDMHAGGDAAAAALHRTEYRGRVLGVSQSRPWDPA